MIEPKPYLKNHRLAVSLRESKDTVASTGGQFQGCIRRNMLFMELFYKEWSKILTEHSKYLLKFLLLLRLFCQFVEPDTKTEEQDLDTID